MQKWPFSLMLGTAFALSACESTVSEPRHAQVTSAHAAAHPATASALAGAAVDAPIAGLAGAVWSDPNNSGYVTGYTYKGQYHPGTPPRYDPKTHSVRRK